MASRSNESFSTRNPRLSQNTASEQVIEADAPGRAFDDELFVLFEVELKHDVLHGFQILGRVRLSHETKERIDLWRRDFLH